MYNLVHSDACYIHDMANIDVFYMLFTTWRNKCMLYGIYNMVKSKVCYIHDIVKANACYWLYMLWKMEARNVVFMTR